MSLVKTQFNIILPAVPTIVYMDPRVTRWVNPECFPRLTLLLQTIVGGLVIFWEVAVRNGFCGCPPNVVESVGIPFLPALLSIFCGTNVCVYVHYPTISTDMIHRVKHREAAFNNSDDITKNPVLSKIKVAYYWVFAGLYCLLGQFPKTVFVNSTWTKRHIEYLWRRKVTVLYPPCNVSKFSSWATEPSLPPRDPCIVSLGQFRPEKDHALQLRSFAQAYSRLPQGAKLYLIGGARNDEDFQRVQQLKDLAAALGLTSAVEFCVSFPFTKVVSLLQRAAVGLHTMKNEHFGIVIVEYLAAGCLPVANGSGGVLTDILAPPPNATTCAFGRLCSTEEAYATAMVDVLKIWATKPEDFAVLQKRGLERAQQFCDEKFCEEFVKTFCSSVVRSTKS